MQNVDGFIFQYVNKKPENAIKNKKVCNNVQSKDIGFEYWTKDGVKRKINDEKSNKVLKEDISFQFNFGKYNDKTKKGGKKNIKENNKNNDKSKVDKNIKKKIINNKKDNKIKIKKNEEETENIIKDTNDTQLNESMIDIKIETKKDIIDIPIPPKKNNISPLKYYEIVDNSLDLEEKIIGLINYSVDFICEREKDKELVEISKLIKNSIKDINLKREAKVEELDRELEEIKEEIVKWEEVKEEIFEKNIVEIKSFDKVTRKEDAYEFKDFNYKVNKLTDAMVVIRKYVKNAKSKCEDMFKKMFSFIHNGSTDPLLLLSALSKLRIN
ncbi:hypothetical protein SLOPH_1008 [Spraguea lophii 42_110]|uniref:Uncharacterized protein n=1 Tax=Spraguea lophii (strain 42_110) TaxID=1358809 RepID=S7WAP4_SPRLO|nr:hypothetical protein SLOPH_1008 [Spraguea lophii 42_110]